MIPSVIILEGADGTGKTHRAQTLFAELSHSGFPFELIHNDVPPATGNLELLYGDQIHRAIHGRNMESRTTVIDRSFLSELVYGDYFRGGSRVSTGQALSLENFAKRNNVKLYGMVAELEVRRYRLNHRGEDFTLNDVNIGARYEHYFHASTAWMVQDTSRV